VTKGKAAGSTPAGAFSSLPIPPRCFGEAYRAAMLFVSFLWLFLLESHQKPKQTPPNYFRKVVEDYVSKFLQYLRNIQCLGWGGDFLQIYNISKIKVNNK
jgi:hypothetical protein